MIKWSPEFAYGLGLIVSDGSLSNDGRHIEFTSKDLELIELFKSCWKLNSKISIKLSGSGKSAYRVQFSNVKLYRDLVSIGLRPNKSKTIQRLQVPSKYLFDFIRGNFDGDGTFYFGWDHRWPRSSIFYLEISSGSLRYLEWLRMRIYKEIGIKGFIVQNRRAWRLRYAKSETKILIKKMYYSTDIPYLERKFAKIQNAEVVEQEDTHP